MDDVVAHSSTSAAILGTRLSRGTPAHDTSRNPAVRINHAQKLLETTALSVTDIAAQSGFASLNHFFECFTGEPD